MVSVPSLSSAQATPLPQVPLSSNVRRKGTGDKHEHQAQHEQDAQKFLFMPFLLYFLEWVLSV